MATIKPVAEPNEKFDEPWKPPQRAGRLGVDYDELGMEMAPNARVWKKYVEETDRMDKELVEGWNNSLDIILIFAALFSAISTAFVIESSKDLKPDYSQTSAQTLQLMSQILSAMARGSPLNDSDTTVAEAQGFTPSSSAVAVNALWFLSLGLSVAVSLIAILAKEWCHSFMAGRVGSMLRQARLRQQRWDGIERWKVKEILYVLPLLMHTALLLFAVGLSLYLWDIDIRVALPVVITTSLAGLFYVVTVSLPLFFRFCPYTTALARFLYPYWLVVLGSRRTMDILGVIIASLEWISYIWARTKDIANHGLRSATEGARTGDDIEATENSPLDTPSFLFREKVEHARKLIQQWLGSMRGMSSTDRSQLVERDTPMDNVTSSMVVWMIVNCEDSRSVDMALQALAGAKQPLPRKPLWECGTVDLLYQRIYDCTSIFPDRRSDGLQPARTALLDDASLYSRSFSFLSAFIAGEGLDLSDISRPYFIVRDDDELITRLEGAAFRMQHSLCFVLPEILNYAWEQPTPRYDLVAYELSVVPVNASMHVWTRMDFFRKQSQKQQKLVQHITAGKVADLPAGALLALINGITKSYLYDALQSPKLLVDLLYLLEPRNELYLSYRDALGLGLGIAAFVAGKYPGEDTRENYSPASESRLHLAKEAYMKLTDTMDPAELSTLLCFGLLSSLDHKTEGIWTLDTAEINLIGYQLETCWTALSYSEVLPGIPPSFDCGHHVFQILSALINNISSDKEPSSTPESALPVLSRIEAVLTPPMCGARGDKIVPLLTEHFTSTDSAQLKRLCLQGIKYSLDGSSYWLDAVLDSLVQTALLTQLLEATTSMRNDWATIPYCMEFLWIASQELLDLNAEWVPEPRRSAARSLLCTLANPFTTSSSGDGYPGNRDEMGLANLWLPKIYKLCRHDPQCVLNSKLLRVMVEFYEFGEHSTHKPRTTELPDDFDNTWTWLEILQYLARDCKEVMERPTSNIPPIKKEFESIPAICGGERHEGEGEPGLDMHDWSL